MKTLQDISLHDIAPSSIKHDININAIIEALDPELKLVTSDIQQEFILSQIDNLPEEIINALAWQFHVDFYDLAKDLDSKRTQVKDSIQWHMKKGTAWAIIKALDMIGVDAEFINWYEDNSTPYTFKIKANIRHDYFNYGDKDKIINHIVRAVYESKAARSLMSKLDARLIEKVKHDLFAGIAQGQSGNVRININLPEPPELAKIIYGIAQLESGSKLINISRPSGDKSTLYHGIGTGEFRDINLGVDLDTMQELLQAFERRIFDRIESHEKLLLAEIHARDSEINAKIDEILDLLKWEESDAVNVQ